MPRAMNGFRLKTLKNSLPKNIKIQKIEIEDVMEGIILEYKIYLKKSLFKKECIQLYASNQEMILEKIKEEILLFYKKEEESKKKTKINKIKTSLKRIV